MGEVRGMRRHLGNLGSGRPAQTIPAVRAPRPCTPARARAKRSLPSRGSSLPRRAHRVHPRVEVRLSRGPLPHSRLLLKVRASGQSSSREWPGTAGSLARPIPRNAERARDGFALCLLLRGAVAIHRSDASGDHLDVMAGGSRTLSRRRTRSRSGKTSSNAFALARAVEIAGSRRGSVDEPRHRRSSSIVHRTYRIFAENATVSRAPARAKPSPRSNRPRAGRRSSARDPRTALRRTRTTPAEAARAEDR